MKIRPLSPSPPLVNSGAPICSKVELTVLVVEPEGLPQLPLHLLFVLLDQELGRQLNELRELQFSGSVEVNLADDFLR